MDNQKIMIKLINEIDNIISDIYDLDDLLLPESVENLNEFSRKIDEILINGLNYELLQMINKLEYKDIFLVHNEINKSDFISKVFLGIYGSDNDLFKYSSYYKNIKNIDEILFEQLKDTLKSDPYKFIKSSDIIKQNKKIIELVTSIDSRLNAYAK